MHGLLRLRLALVERLISNLKRINREDRRTLNMDLLEKILVFMRNSVHRPANWFENAYTTFKVNRRVRNPTTKK